MRSFFAKLGGFFSWIGQKIVQGGKWLVTGLLLLAIIVVGVLLANNGDDETEPETTSDRPEIAQVFEPSIGTPLPPDRDGSDSDETTESITGEVAGEEDTQSSPSEESNDTEERTDQTDNNQEATPESNNSETPRFIAPATGINPNAPIDYSSPLGFSITLPAGSNVIETGNTVQFTKNNQLLFSVEQTGNQTQSDIIAQLKLSSASNISAETFAGKKAVRFTLGGQSGLAIQTGQHTLYLIGDASYLNQISL